MEITKENFDKVISKIKCDLLLHQQFFGLILAKINVKLVNEDNEKAAAYTNGKNIYFIEKHIEEFNFENIKFIICHEIMHLLLDHLIRREDKNPIIWNFATDYIVNFLLKNNRDSNGNLDPIGEMPECCLYDSKYDDSWNAESIYEDLLKNNGSGDGKLQIINLSPKDNRDMKSDLHTSQDGSKKGEVSKENATYFASEICSNLDKGCSKSELPSCITRILNSLQDINYNWKSILYKYIKKIMIKNNSTWKRPSRRSVAVKTYLPKTMKTEYFKFTIAIDTSGSMEKQDIDDVLSNILSMCRQLDKFTLNIFTFSGVCHKETLQTFTEKDIFKKINDFKMETNWSTDIRSAFEFVQTNKDLQDSDLFIVMTDGIDGMLPLLGYKNPLIWCICNNPNFKNPEGCSKATVIPMPRGKK